MKNILTIRTITGYLQLCPGDFPSTTQEGSPSQASSSIASKVARCAELLREIETELVNAEYAVQSVRMATNPFGEWIYGNSDDTEGNKSDLSFNKALVKQRLHILDTLLSEHDIGACALGPALNTQETLEICPLIIQSSGRFFCSSAVNADNVESAFAAAQTIVKISKLGSDSEGLLATQQSPHIQGGLGNFRFCAAASCKPYIPFFPGAKADSMEVDGTRSSGIKFAFGLENGLLAKKLLGECQSIGAVRTKFRLGMIEALLPVQDLGDKVAKRHKDVEFVGIDSSLNPSLEEDGSVAHAMEQLKELHGGEFGGPGTLAAASEITRALQNLDGIKLTGYCGLMLPVLEDRRLAELATVTDQKDRELRISDILSISSVCGVGVDTVPIPGDCSFERLGALILDVSGIAGRWNKSLSCRVFPVPGKGGGDMTEFDSPYMCNCGIFDLS